MRSLWVSVFCGLIAVAAGAAHAELGQRAASISADGTHFRARVASQARLGFNDNVLTIAGGTTMHEFTGDDGTVFAVSWQGARRPDLKQLFGAGYFNRFQDDNKAPVGHVHMRRALASSHADFVVRTGGYSGASWGYAYLPAKTPATFSPQNLQ